MDKVIFRSIRSVVVGACWNEIYPCFLKLKLPSHGSLSPLFFCLLCSVFMPWFRFSVRSFSPSFYCYSKLAFETYCFLSYFLPTFFMWSYFLIFIPAFFLAGCFRFTRHFLSLPTLFREALYMVCQETQNVVFLRFLFEYGTVAHQFFGPIVKISTRGSQRDVYLGWQIAPSYMIPNAEGGMLRGLSQ